MTSVTPVQTSELRPSSPSPQAPKSGNPFAMLLDTVSAKRPSAPEPRRRPDAPDSPRVNGAEKPERPQPRQNAKPVTEKSKPAAHEAKQCSTPEETAANESEVKAKNTEEGKPTDAATVEGDTLTEEAVMLPVDGEASADAGAGEGQTDSDAPMSDADAANEPSQADADADAVIVSETLAQPVVQQAITPETAPVPAPVAAAEAAVDAAAEMPVAAVAAKVDASAGKQTKPQVALTADAEASVAGEEAPQIASPQASKPEETSPSQKPVVSNHAEARDAAIAEKGEQATQSKASKPDVPAQAKEHASAKPLEHVPAQSSVENSAPRQQLMPQTMPVMPEPVRALAGSINPVNLRVASDGPNNAVQLNAQAIGVEIASRAKEGMRRFDIRLDPPELGRIDVRLEVDNTGKVSTRLIVERPETLDLLQRDARNLERALQSAGLQTDEGGLEFSLQQQGQNDFADAGSDRGYNRRSDFFASAIDEAEPASPAMDRYARSVLARGGVDISI